MPRQGPMYKNLRAIVEPRLIEMAHAGYGNTQIGLELNVGKDTVAKWRRELLLHGLVPPPLGRGRRPAWDDHSKPQREVPYVAKQRNCLLCHESFTSEWPGERVCKRCKQTDAWRGCSL